MTYTGYRISKNRLAERMSAREKRQRWVYTCLVQAYAGLVAGYTPAQIHQAMAECYDTLPTNAQRWLRRTAYSVDEDGLARTLDRWWTPAMGEPLTRASVPRI